MVEIIFEYEPHELGFTTVKYTAKGDEGKKVTKTYGAVPAPLDFPSYLVNTYTILLLLIRLEGKIEKVHITTSDPAFVWPFLKYINEHFNLFNEGKVTFKNIGKEELEEKIKETHSIEALHLWEAGSEENRNFYLWEENGNIKRGRDKPESYDGQIYAIKIKDIMGVIDADDPNAVRFIAWVVMWGKGTPQTAFDRDSQFAIFIQPHSSLKETDKTLVIKNKMSEEILNELIAGLFV